MRREWCIWLQLTFVAAWTFLVSSSISPSIVHCNASISANETCIVPYLSSVWLHCPNEGRSSGYFAGWWFGKKSVCDQPDCNIYISTSVTSGVYLCRATQSTSQAQVQLNVLAPPALSKVSTCVTYLSPYCKSPQPMFSMSSSEMKATVYYTGNGNISVTWSKKSESSGIYQPFQCAPSNCVLGRSTPNQQSIAIKITNPFQIDDIGSYRANVSNEYGFNTTVTILNITCDPKNTPQLPFPIQVTINPITIKVGTNQNISCSAEMDSSTSLMMCYQSAGDNSSDCGVCPAFTEGYCYPLGSKRWKIVSGRTYPLGPCKPQRVINATIIGVQPSDAGLFSCYWTSAVFKKIHYLSYNVSVVYDLSSSPSPLPLSVTPPQRPITIVVAGLIAGVGVVACLVTISITVRCVVKRCDVKPRTDTPTIIVRPQKCDCQVDRDSAPSEISLHSWCENATTNV